MKIYSILEHEYNYWKNCKDFSDGNEVQEIVEYDDFSYSEDTFYHNPELSISKERFLSMVDNDFIKSIGKKFNKYVFFGYNSYYDILFAYDFKNDRHDFFKRLM